MPFDIDDNWEQNTRGISVLFGHKHIDQFLEKQNLEMIVRAHQVMADGYEFFHKRKLVTIFSAPNYCGSFDNAGAMLIVNQDLVCRFIIFKSTSYYDGHRKYMSSQAQDKSKVMHCQAETMYRSEPTVFRALEQSKPNKKSKPDSKQLRKFDTKVPDNYPLEKS